MVSFAFFTVTLALFLNQEFPVEELRHEHRHCECLGVFFCIDTTTLILPL